MKHAFWLIFFSVIGLAATGCQSQNQSQIFAATLAPESVSQLLTATQTAAPTTTTDPPTTTASPTIRPSITPSPEPAREERFALIRPIRVNDNSIQRDYIDRTYPYGDTQSGTRQVHTGVEFVNPRGTAVIAAESGQVVYAGTDDAIQIGPRLGFYGNVIILRHDDLRSPTGDPVYTLYGHLDRIQVIETGVVSRGMIIGEVGDSGIAIGPHLHFEVRVGGDPLDFLSTRNPDLWILPYSGSGMLVGRVTDLAGNLLHGITIDIRSLRTNNLLYAFSYGPELVNSDIAWHENFTRGDLTAGEYIVTVVDNGNVRFQQRITIEDQHVTWLDVILD